MKSVNIIFPNQLFKDIEWLQNGNLCYLVEEFLFFKQFSFHKQKLAYHRSTMMHYADYLHQNNVEVAYINSFDSSSDILILLNELRENGVKELVFRDPDDERLSKKLDKFNFDLRVMPNLQFLNKPEELAAFFKPNAKKLFQTSFYKKKRIKLNILLEKDGTPQGGKWSFDEENRKAYPKKNTPPQIQFPDKTAYYLEAKTYVQQYFPNNYGALSDHPVYPINFEQADIWLHDFFNNRFAQFGDYEDALVSHAHFLHHSVLTPMLNTGILTPDYVIGKALKYAKDNAIPINSLEGFIRQIIGWREFIRGVYISAGNRQRTKNFWGFKRKIPKSFYDGSTGVLPVDVSIKKCLKTGYNHHIERLMVLGNFMLLCEFDPDEVYKWFMEMYIDAYDWVMVPNVYGMSQFADGGLMATKPYISGSNYLLKMGDYTKGPWQEIWDALFWRFMHVHRSFFLTNPRLGMLVSNYDKMPPEKRNVLLSRAEAYLEGLGGLAE